MKTHSMAARLPARLLALALLVGTLFPSVALLSAPAQADARHNGWQRHAHAASHGRVTSHVHPSGHRQRRKTRTEKGIASVYHRGLQGRKMADGGRFRVSSNSAASRTLPLGTVALVTNLENGRRQKIRIRDRGPYVGHRLVDLSPATARNLGMMRPGLIRVSVTPISFPS